MSRPDGSVTYPSYPGRANFSQWRIQGRAPLLLDQTETRKAEKCFLDPPPHPAPLISGSEWPGPSLFWRSGPATVSYISLQNLANRLSEKQKVDLGSVIPLAGPAFLHINALARPAGSTRSRRENQSMRQWSWLGQRGQIFSHINVR